MIIQYRNPFEYNGNGVIALKTAHVLLSIYLILLQKVCIRAENSSPCRAFKVWWRQLWSTAWAHQRTAASSHRRTSDRSTAGGLCVLLAEINRNTLVLGIGCWLDSWKWLCLVFVRWNCHKSNVKSMLVQGSAGYIVESCYLTRGLPIRNYTITLLPACSLSGFLHLCNRILSCSNLQIPMFQIVR